MVYKKYKMKTYELHTINTNRFKLVHVEIIFRNNVVKDDITKRNVLFDYLLEATNKYKTKRDINLQLENIYNAGIYTTTSKVGGSIITNICMDYLADCYTKDDNTTKNAFELLFDIVFNPLSSNNEFDSKILKYVKEKNKNIINSVKENPRKHAIINSYKTLSADSPTSYSTLGSVSDIDLINEINLYEYYEKVINEDYVDIYVVGNIDSLKIKSIVSKYAKFNVIKNHDVILFNDKNKKRKCIIASDETSNKQSNIVFILNLNGLSDYEKKYVASVYNTILGGGSLETKLYKKIRGEHSLCYNIGSIYQKNDGIILIYTALSETVVSKAIKLIKDVLMDMTNNIKEEELETAKKILVSSMDMLKDNSSRIVDFYYFENIGSIEDFDTRKKKYNQVSIEDIYRLSKKISISTIYDLKGECNEKK